MALPLSKKNILIATFLFLLFSFSSFAQDKSPYQELNTGQVDSLVQAYYKQRKYNDIISLLEFALDRAKQKLDWENAVDYTNNLGFFHSALGKRDKALAFYIQSKDIAEKLFGVEHPRYASALMNIAHTYQKKGNHAKALPLFLQAQNVIKKSLGTESSQYSKVVFDLASLYLEMNNDDAALPLLLESRSIREKSLGKKHRKIAPILISIANIYKRKGLIDQGLELTLQAKEISIAAVGEIHIEVARANMTAANFYSERGEHDKALDLNLKTKNIYAQTLGEKHPYYILVHNSIATVYIEKMNYKEAFDYIQKALQICSQTNISKNITAVWVDSLSKATYRSSQHLEATLASLNLLYSLLNRDSSTQNTQQKKIWTANLANQLLSKLQNDLSNDKDKLRILKDRNYWLRISLSLLSPNTDALQAFALADQNKSALLLQATKSEEIYRLGNLPDSLIKQDKALIKKQHKLQAKLQEKRSPEEKQKILTKLNEANLEIDFLAKTIEKEYPKYHKLKYQNTEISTKEIQATLDKKTALIEYVISNKVIHIFYISQQETKWIQQEVNHQDLTLKIKDLHSTLSNYNLLLADEKKSYRKYTQLSYWFFQNLLDPILKDSKGIENLVLIPDGELGHLPFEVFLMEQPPQEFISYKKLHYLVQDYNISYNYSAALWKDNTQVLDNKNNGQILALAADYGLKPNPITASFRLPTDLDIRNKLAPLPAAYEEVKALEEQFNGFFGFGEQASEKILKQKASDYAVLHLAMHGILNSEQPVLSSLALTEDGDSLENNFWQAHEISKMDLNADLVVLSACETGFGRFEEGNGIASLARSFMYAGAPSLIVSLWQVNDVATALIMKKLYSNLADGIPKNKALRQAKLDYMEMAKGVAAHPAFWSPFIQIGNSKPISLSNKKNWLGWGLGIGILLVIGITIIRKKYKTAYAK